ncbi:MAG: arginine--tRNA ligase [Planctomycetes bacterium]|nr:arginine--tRNA ligase [Planctomycetota bacterium]
MTTPGRDLPRLVGALLERHGGAAELRKVDLRSSPKPFADARLIFASGAWLGGTDGQRFLQELEAESAIESVRRKQATVSLRVADAWLVEYARALAIGEAPEPTTAAAGQRYLVGFAGPNTSKALHLGHLRNVVLGHALACALEAAGASVLRHSLVGDIGRNAAEAMAGYLELGSDEDPEHSGSGEKLDHFVGRCYRAYLRAHQTTSGSGLDPNHRESVAQNDPADELLARWAAGDPEVRALWGRLRDAVLSGHRETLQRLGITIDRHDFESDAVGEALALQDRGVAGGVLTHTEGSVAYLSDRSEFECMVLRRSDGFPTEHGRLLAVYERVLGESPPSVYLDLAGDEWQPASAIHGEILHALSPGEHRQRHVQLFHGMVTLGADVVSSSVGEPELIDAFWGRVAELPELVAEVPDALQRAVFVDHVVKGYLLSFPTRKRLPLDAGVFADTTRPGWSVARAWLGTADASQPGGDPDPGHDGDRLVMLRAQEFDHRLCRAVELRETDGLASYVIGVCSGLSEHPPTAAFRPAIRPVLARMLGSLGLRV